MAKRCGELSGNVNKAGEPCRAYARTGEGKTTCIAHASRAEQDEAGFGGSENGQKGGEARKVPKLTELLRDRLEAEAEKIMNRLLEGLDADAAVVVGTGPDAFLDTHPDHAIRLRTIREIWDRLEGRPKSTTEFTGEVTHRNAEKIDREVERLTERLAEQMTAKQDEPAPS